MTDLFLTLLDRSLSASFVVFAVLAARLLLKRAPKAMHCALWALVALRLIFPVSFETALSLVPELPSPPIAVEESLPESVQHLYWDESSKPGDRMTVSYPNERGENEIYEVYLAEDGTTRAVNPRQEPLKWPVIGSYLWLTGMVAMLLFSAFSYLRIAKQVRASIDLGNGVYLCDYIDTPFILGIGKPKIYLPSMMDPRDAGHVLAHEKAHLKRRDHWWKPLGFLLLSIHWFNPLLWLAYILLCRDIELACDERVIKTMGHSDKKDYSEALLKCSVPRHMILACPLAFGEVGVKQRIKSVLHYKKPGFWILLVSILVILIVAVCFLTDPKPDTLADFYNGNRTDVTCVDLLSHKGHVCLSDPSDLSEVWTILEDVEYEPQPHTSEAEWDTMIDDFYAYTELEFNIGEELRYLYFYPDFSSVCVEDENGNLNHYIVKDPAPLETLYATYIDHFSWHEVTAQPFATVDQPYQWMQNVTVNALQGVRTRHSDTSHSSGSSSVSPVQAEKLLKILKAIPESALSGPETIGEGGTDWITTLLTDKPNMIVSFQDAANDLGVLIRYYEKTNGTHLEIVMIEDSDTVSSSYHHKIKTACKWDIESEALLSYMKDIIEHRPSVITFVGAEYVWMDERPTVSGGGASIQLRIIDGWQYEITQYTEGCESFGIRVRPAGVTEGWVYFSFWPGGYFPEEVNRSFAEHGGGNMSGYTSYPKIRDWHYGTGDEPFLWTYRRYPMDIGDFAIINENADNWILEYGDALSDTETFCKMEGGTQETFVLPETTLVPVDYPQSDNEQHGFKHFSFDTKDPAKLSVNSAWIYDETVQKYDGHVHFGAFWPEYVTEGRVCMEYWEGGFQPEANVTVEEMEIGYYGGHHDGFTGTYPGDEHFTYLWINRDHGSYVFRFENTQNWRDFYYECAIYQVICNISF